MRAPIEEAATPLPREEHTPPVTKISFFMGFQYPGRSGDCQLIGGPWYLIAVDYVITREESGRVAYYTVGWSPFAKADKYEITRSVPAMGGIAEIYYRDREGKLNLFCLQRSWYGGLRAVLRERCDASLEKDPWRLSILVKWRERIYYRWTNSESFADMADVMYFLVESSCAGAGGVSSGRFDRIFVKEIDAGKLVTI